MQKQGNRYLLTGDEVMFEQFVDPFRRHYYVPLPILEVLLPLISHFSGLLNHALNLIRVKRIENFEEEISFWKLPIVVRKIFSYERPVPNLAIYVLDVQAWPVRNRLSRDFLLLQNLLLAIEDALQEDQFAFVQSWKEVATYRNCEY